MLHRSKTGGIEESIALFNRFSPEFPIEQQPLSPNKKTLYRPPQLNSLQNGARQTAVSMDDEEPMNSSLNLQKQKHLSITSIPDIPQEYRFSLNSEGTEKCQKCDYEGQMKDIYTMGWVAFSWVVFFFLATIVLFWVPLAFNCYKEKRIECPECSEELRVIKPTCL